MTQILTDIEGLEKSAIAELESISDGDALVAWKKEYLGPKGRVTSMLGAMKDVEPTLRKEVGQRLNGLKNALQSALDDREKSLGAGVKPKSHGPQLDVTEPGIDPRLGKSHVISRTIDELIDVFGRMGFSVAHGPEVEDEYHNFVALNIPEDHPARDPLENFYIDGTHLLRTQTSTVQIREMESRKPPLRIVSFGRVYRPDEVDATHSFMFHQIEGLYVDRNVSMVDLKTTLLQFAHAYFGAQAEVRLVPSFFPFTEPSAEMYIKMQVKGQWQWVELGGCGLVDPNVFKAVGYDPEEWTGFAFGLGIERIAMRKYGVPDIRWLYENDLRFLRQV
jgi:phenylalanyl-tRNA synthetase alpha chain